MANPAELLHGLFVEWNNAANSVRFARKDDSLVAHRRAVKHLEDIDRLLGMLENQGRKVDVYRRQHPEWVKIVFNYPKNWQANNSAKIAQTAIDHLETLINHIDDVVPRSDKRKTQNLKEYLFFVLKTLNEDDSLSMATRLHAQATINHVLGCIDDLAVVGDFQFEQAVERFLAVLFRVMRESQMKDMWKTAADNFVWPFTVSTLSALPGALLTQLALGS